MVDQDLNVVESKLEVGEEECKICLSKTIVEENLATVLEALATFNSITAGTIVPVMEYDAVKLAVDDLLLTTRKMSEIVSFSTEAIEKLKNCDCVKTEEETLN